MHASPLAVAVLLAAAGMLSASPSPVLAAGTAPSAHKADVGRETDPAGERRLARASRSCGSMVVEHAVTYDLTIVKGAPSCSTVRRIMKRFGHPISKHPRFYCGVTGYECEYSIYPEGWRCGGLFQGHFQCWHGANSPARATEIFEGSEAFAKRLRRSHVSRRTPRSIQPANIV